LNFDNSPTLRIERIPIVGSILGRLSGNGQRFPAAVLYGDICKGLPIKDGTVKGAYASHVLEHLSLEDFRTALANTRRMLAPGGVFRLIVPDLEARARLYLRAIEEKSPDAASCFMRAAHLGDESTSRTLLQRARRMFGGSAHLWMWDQYAIAAELERSGFEKIRRCDFGDSSDPCLRGLRTLADFMIPNTTFVNALLKHIDLPTTAKMLALILRRIFPIPEISPYSFYNCYRVTHGCKAACKIDRAIRGKSGYF
jgi:hypothetical protein